MEMTHMDLAIERVITLNYIHTGLEVENPFVNHESSQWNGYSYRQILQHFADTRKNNEALESWLERIAFIYPAFSRIPLNKLDEEALFKLASFEHRYTELSHEQFFEKMRTGTFVKAIHCAVSQANKLIQYGEGEYNLETVSPLLHFMLPYVFPIVDEKTSRILNGSKEIAEDIDFYIDFMFGIHTYLLQGTFSNFVWEEAMQLKESPLHIVRERLLDSRSLMSGHDPFLSCNYSQDKP